MAIVGVDTHTDVHVAAAIDNLGVLLGTARSRPPPAATPSCATGPQARAAAPRRVEGTGCYGAALTRYLPADAASTWSRSTGRTGRPAAGAASPTARRRRPPARSVLAGTTAVPKSGDGPVEMLRMVKSPGIRGQGPQPGDQPAAGRTDRADPRLREKLPGWRQAADPPLRRARPRPRCSDRPQPPPRCARLARRSPAADRRDRRARPRTAGPRSPPRRAPALLGATASAPTPPPRC